MKFAPFVIGTIAVGLAVGWLAPGAPEPVSEPVVAEQDEDDARLGALQAEEWFAGEHSLPRARDGHFYAEVTVGSEAALMMVDTGASMIALTADDADTLGVEWSDDDVRPIAKGASGTVYGVPVMLETVQVGEHEANEVEAVVVPEGLEISLLGQSFLSKIRRVEIVGDRMLLGG